MGKKNLKFVPVQDMKACGELQTSLRWFLTSTIDASAALLSGKKQPEPTGYEISWVPQPFWVFRWKKNFFNFPGNK
jgi:hypothetical protein